MAGGNLISRSVAAHLRSLTNLPLASEANGMSTSEELLKDTTLDRSQGIALEARPEASAFKQLIPELFCGTYVAASVTGP